MKIRNGFVSNSSSSSFICAICGEIESGFDQSLNDFEMFSCEHGHEVHIACAKFTVAQQEKFDELGSSYEVPLELCPVCQFKVIEKNDLFRYLLKKNGLSKKDAEKEILAKFPDYSAFITFIK